MTVDITRTIGTQNVALSFDDQAAATRYGDVMVGAVREGQRRLLAAKKIAADAYTVVANGRASTGFYEVVQRYFKLSRPATSAAIEEYKQAVQRILECLSVTYEGLTQDGVAFGQLSQEKVKSGYKGQVPPTATEGMSAMFGSDTHKFTGCTPLGSPMLLDMALLLQNYPLAVNTIVHEATHKFCITWDHAYFGSGGRTINSDIQWYADCKVRILMEDRDNTFFATTPSSTLTRDAARTELLRVMNASNDLLDQPKRKPASAIEAAHQKACRDMDDKANRAAGSAFEAQSVRDLTPRKALNNADSFSCYVMEAPDSAFA